MRMYVYSMQMTQPLLVPSSLPPPSHPLSLPPSLPLDDCACSLRTLSALANNRQDRDALSRHINSTGVDIEPLMGDAGPPCNTVAEGLILEGWSMLQIQGGRLAEL